MTVFSDDLADELLFGCRCERDLKGFAEHLFGFVEQGGVFGEEGDEGLVPGYFVA